MNQISDAELSRYQNLERKVKWILEQRGDDICWRDVYTELANLVNVKYTPELICDRAKHLENCERFIDSLRAGPYIPVYIETLHGPPEEIGTGLYRMVDGEVVGGEPDNPEL